MEFLQSYFNLLIVGCCVVIGYVWTTFTPENDLSRRYIPVVMAVLGTILACIDARGVSLEIILSGSVSGLASTGCYEAFKQLILKPKWIEDKAEER
ncbi:MULTISPECIES: phage holin family protein [Bacteria]|uniref:Holin n=1 Tax=Dubosiella newyorkensis TaxID=1862672 RepID=A0A1U7NKX3_9FIRM|nr:MULTISPECIES: phage holin family protein [Bacteria]OLU45246.1 hypothetical protein BO225_08865 [Dubosiella newyorkensis]